LRRILIVRLSLLLALKAPMAGANKHTGELAVAPELRTQQEITH